MTENDGLKICTDVLSNITSNNLNLARILTYVDENKLYLLGNYKSISEYAKKEFSLPKSTVSKLINICKTFGSEIGYTSDTRTGILAFDGLIKQNSTGFYTIQDDYKKYSYTKLSVMVYLDEKHLKMCSPDLSYRQINDIYRNQKKQDQLKENKLIEDAFEIKADNTNWFNSKDVTNLYKISKLQIRAPDDKFLDEWFVVNFDDKKVKYTDQQKLSVFSVLAMRHYMKTIIDERKEKDETHND